MVRSLDLVAGLVVAGGRSRRMGRDKAVIELGGAPLLARACDRLRPDCAWIAASVRGPGPAADLAAALGMAVAVDPPGLPQGPLSGVLGGLRWAREQGAALLVVAPCDAPFLPQDLSRRLVAATAGASCAMAHTPDGAQPLCSAWKVDAMTEVLGAALAGGRHPPVHAVLEAAGCARIDYPSGEAFLNINAPEALAEAERRLAASRA